MNPHPKFELLDDVETSEDSNHWPALTGKMGDAMQ
jgi:hypothetical protein